MEDKEAKEPNNANIVFISFIFIIFFNSPKNQNIMNDIQLSKNFMLSEFTRSETARRRKINNDAPESVIENLRNLCQNDLQPHATMWASLSPSTLATAVPCSTATLAAARTHSTSSEKLPTSACLSLPTSSTMANVTPTWTRLASG